MERHKQTIISVSDNTGGQAKTIMFVQLNPEAISYTESLSTLKFAERVSGVELGAARSSKDGKDVKELMEQVLNFPHPSFLLDLIILIQNYPLGVQNTSNEPHGDG